MLGTNEGGNERYIKNLAFQLIHDKLANVKILVSDCFHLAPKDRENYGIDEKMLIRHKNNNLYRIFYLLPRLAKQYKIDIIHSTYIAPFFLPKNCMQVLTVHDMSYKRYPNFYSLRDKILFNCFLPISMKKSDAIIVPSFFSKKELLTFFPQYRGKVHVTYEAPDNNIKRVPIGKAHKIIKAKWRISHPFLLTMNSANPKKNIERIISSFNLVNKDFNDLRLVVVGARHNIGKQIDTKNVNFIKNVADEDLSILYSTCKMFIYFSLYEGFGLPVLESMKCKSPTIVSSIPVHREITKKSIVFADPNSFKDLSSKILGLLKNKSLQKKIINNGYDVAKSYTWKKTAQKTIEAYNSILKV